MDEFTARCELLNSLGVRFGVDEEWRGEPPNREPYPLKIFTRVWFPFNADEWCSLFMSDGDNYLGGCCGAMSRVQDLVCSEIRSGSGWFGVSDLEEIAGAMSRHDDLAEGVSFKNLPKGKSLANLVAAEPLAPRRPWSWMALVWHIVKDFRDPERPHAVGPHVEQPERAIHVLSQSLRYLDIVDLFGGHPAKYDDQERAMKLLTVSRVVPALAELNANLEKLDTGPFEGFALIQKEAGPEAICQNGLGYCIYSTEEAAQEILNLWVKADQERKTPKKPSRDAFALRKVRITLKEGLVFLD